MWLFNGVATASQGVTGVMKWVVPRSNPSGLLTSDFRPITYPTSVGGLHVKPTWALDTNTGFVYGAGAWTDNIVVTFDMKMWQLGIQAPTTPPAATLVAGPGITASVVPYWSYYDRYTDEDSPLSGPGPTLSAANQQIQWPTPPTPLNPRVTDIRYWESRDGGLPRLSATRQVGVGSITTATALADLGQAFTDTFDRFPRCRYVAIWHDRLVLAGNDLASNEIYFSLIGKPERRSTITLKTRSGQPVVGLIVVRGTLIVLCPHASEIVTGYTEDDIAIEIAQPQIGAITQHGIQIIHGNAFIPTHLGLYLCDGSSWFFVADDLKFKWAFEYKANEKDYENAFSFHDPVNFAYGFYVSDGHSDFPSTTNVAWVADYQPVTQQLGGGYGQPNWSYDSFNRDYESSGLLGLPGARRHDSYFGACDGKVYKYDPDNGSDGGDTRQKLLKLRTGADSASDEGGDVAHGKRFTEVDLFVVAEDSDWTINLYSGDEQAHTGSPQFTRNVDASSLSGFQVKGTHHFVTPRLVGTRLVVEVVATAPTDVEWRGYQFYWKEGERPRYPVPGGPPGGG